MYSSSLTLRCFTGFPDGLVVKNLPASAKDTGYTPGLGRSHMPTGEQQSPCTTATKAEL